MMKGQVHLYTGNGKGKTTAALGLALRALGSGKKVYMAQFVKGMPYSELDAISGFLPEMRVVQFGRDCFIEKEPTAEDIEAARKGLEETGRILQAGAYDVFILDEVCIALHYQLFSLEELLRVLTKRKQDAELILTGRYAPQGLIDFADLVTEMKEIKHYYQKGINARVGIEK